MLRQQKNIREFFERLGTVYATLMSIEIDSTISDNDLLCCLNISLIYLKYATYATKFKAPNIGTTTTSPVYHYYEFNELSSIRLSMIIAFAIMAAACVLRLLIARIQTTEVPRCINCTTNHHNRRHTALRVDFLRHEARQVVHEIPYQAFHRTVPETSATAAPDVWLHDFTPLPHDDFKKSTAG